VKNFLLGFLTASAGFLLFLFLRGAPSSVPAALPDGGPAPSPVEKRKRRHGSSTAAPRSPADLHPTAEGDNLSTPDVLDVGAAGPEGELSQEEVDARFRARQPEILACIDQARGEGDAPVSGRVIVKFRIQRSGAVRGMRIEAPRFLMQNGLYRCIRPLVTGLRFSASGQSLVLTYPFTLE
jgi:hypothetical protein